jgi:hypothetical protein
MGVWGIIGVGSRRSQRIHRDHREGIVGVEISFAEQRTFPAKSKQE